MNPFVFVVGCPRSGTTLVQRILDARADLAVVNETHWIPKVVRHRRGVTDDGLATPALVDHLLADRRFPKLGVSEAELRELVCRSPAPRYADVVTSLFDLFARGRGKVLAGDKTPPYVREIELLHSLWPEARFVHVVRDGRSVSLSVRSWRKQARVARQLPTWDDDPVASSGVWWARAVLLGGEGGAAIGPAQYHELRYEALVEQPEHTVADLSQFLGLPPDDAMLRFHEGRTRDEPGLDAKHAWQPVTAGLRDWRVEMPAADVEVFEAVAADALDALGYERHFPDPSSGVRERARAVRTRALDHWRGRHQRLPVGW